MTVLALLMTALSGSIGFAGRSWDRGWQASERSASLARVEETVRQLIERVFPVATRVQKKDRFLFAGTAHSLRLVAYDAAGRSMPGLYVQEIVDEISGGQHRLLYRRYPYVRGGPQAAAIDEAPLLAGSFGFNFSYFGALKPGAAPAWFDKWESERTLPELIKLQIEDGGATAWQPIIVRPMVTADYACLDSSLPGICRLEDRPQ